eukprot:COSAG02_NODE_1467_length_12482_cov_6.138577_7_plen_133_part_00
MSSNPTPNRDVPHLQELLEDPDARRILLEDVVQPRGQVLLLVKRLPLRGSLHRAARPLAVARTCTDPLYASGAALDAACDTPQSSERMSAQIETRLSAIKNQNEKNKVSSTLLSLRLDAQPIIMQMICRQRL